MIRLSSLLPIRLNSDTCTCQDNLSNRMASVGLKLHDQCNCTVSYRAVFV